MDQELQEELMRSSGRTKPPTRFEVDKPNTMGQSSKGVMDLIRK